MIRVLNQEEHDIASHKCDVMMFSCPSDLSKPVLDRLEARYPGLIGMYADLMKNEKFVPGTIAIVSWGSERVMFANPMLHGKINYIKVRDCFDKMANVPEKHKFKSIAIPHFSPADVSPRVFEAIIHLRTRDLSEQEFNIYIR